MNTSVDGDPPQEALPAEALLRRAMAEYAGDPERAGFLMHYACTQAPNHLPLYRVIYKFYNRQRRFESAGDFALRALEEAGRQCGLPLDPTHWTRRALFAGGADAASEALLALKAMVFIALRRGDQATADRHLALLRELDPEDGSGVSVVSALAESVGG